MEYERHIQWCLRRDDLTGEKLKIYGELYLPEGAQNSALTHQRLPCVALAHPFGATQSFMEPYAQALASHGLVAYAIDFCGGGLLSRSDLQATDMSVETEALDLEVALGLLRDQPFCDTSNIFLLGASQGGLVSSLVAARNPELVKALVLLYPAFSIPSDTRRIVGAGEIPQGYDMLGMRVGARYVRDAMACRPLEELASFGGSTLIMHGDQDRLVPLSYSERAAGELPGARLEVIEGAGHGFSGEALRRSLELTTSFIDQELFH